MKISSVLLIALLQMLVDSQIFNWNRVSIASVPGNGLNGGHGAASNQTGFYTFGGYTVVTLEPSNVFRFYSVKSNSWTTFGLNIVRPSARAHFILQPYPRRHPTTGQLLAALHGGAYYSAIKTSAEIFNDLWVLNLDTAEWTLAVVSSGSAFARCYHAAAYDAHQDKFILHGGMSTNTGVAASINNQITEISLTAQRKSVDQIIYSYSVSHTTLTTAVSSFGTNPAIVAHSMIYSRDFVNNKSQLVIYGGSVTMSGSRPSPATLPCQVMTCTMRFNTPRTVDNCTWSAFSPVEPFTANRYGHRAIYNPVSKRMIVMGGVVNSTYLHPRVSYLDMPSSVTSQWKWTVLDSPQSNMASGVLYPALFTLPVDDNLVALVRFGGVKALGSALPTVFPIDGSANFPLSSDIEAQVFYTGSYPDSLVYDSSLIPAGPPSSIIIPLAGLSPEEVLVSAVSSSSAKLNSGWNESYQTEVEGNPQSLVLLVSLCLALGFCIFVYSKKHVLARIPGIKKLFTN